jgi:uncharacterized membrane protein
MTVFVRARFAGMLWLLLVTVLVWLYSFMALKLPHQSDTLVHLQWASQFVAALREGWLLPRWAAASMDGLGDPTFLYYQPLFYYLTSAFALLGLNAGHALLGAAMVPFLLLGGVVYVGLGRHYPHRQALIGATFMLLCPVLFFVTASVGAFPWALSLPFSVLFVAESVRDKPRPAWLAVLLSLICLSHLLSGLMALAAVGLGRLAFAWPNRANVAGHRDWAAGVVLGLGLPAFFLFPALTQLHLINPDGWVDGANFDWRRAFALPTVTFARYGLRWFAIQLPLAAMALVLCLVVLLPVRGSGATRGQMFARRLGWVAVAALALGSELAYPLYALLTPLQKLQFPYRFVFLALLLANLALVIQLNEGAWARWRGAVRAAVLGLVLAQLTLMAYLQWDLYRRGERIPAESAFMAGHFGQPEYIPAVRGPQWQRYIKEDRFAGECARLRIDCRETRQQTHAFATRIGTAGPVSVRLPLWAFPAWRVSVDGTAVGLDADPDTGLISVPVPPGEHAISVTWSRMPAEVAGWWISAASGALLAGSLGMARWRSRRLAQVASQPAIPERAPRRMTS